MATIAFLVVLCVVFRVLNSLARDIARHLGIEAVSMSPEQAAEHFKAFPFIDIDVKMPNEATSRMQSPNSIRPPQPCSWRTATSSGLEVPSSSPWSRNR